MFAGNKCPWSPHKDTSLLLLLQECSHCLSLPFACKPGQQEPAVHPSSKLTCIRAPLAAPQSWAPRSAAAAAVTSAPDHTRLGWGLHFTHISPQILLSATLRSTGLWLFLYCGFHGSISIHTLRTRGSLAWDHHVWFNTGKVVTNTVWVDSLPGSSDFSADLLISLAVLVSFLG